MTRGTIALRAGVKSETVRYYERVGLLPEPQRTPSGHRRYIEQDLRRLAFIRRSRELGFSLEEIRGLLELVDGGYTCGDVLRRTRAHIENVRDKIHDLQRIEGALECMACECSGEPVPDCPIIDELIRTPQTG